MVDGHSREAWGRQSHLMAVMVNLQIDTKKNKPVTAAMFNPYSAEAANTERRLDKNSESSRMIAQAIAQQEKASG